MVTFLTGQILRFDTTNPSLVKPFLLEIHSVKDANFSNSHSMSYAMR